MRRLSRFDPLSAHRRSHPTGVTGLAGVALTALLAVALVPGPLEAIELNARRTGMGGVSLARPGGDLHAEMYRQVVPRDAAVKTIPLPLGLAQLALDPPTLDPGNPDFSASALIELALSPPYDLRLSDRRPTTDSPTSLELAEDRVVVDLGTAQAFVPADGGRWGETLEGSVWSRRAGPARVSIAPLVIGRATMELSDDLSDALIDAAPIEVEGNYQLDATSEFSASIGLGVSTARRLWQQDPAVSPHGFRLVAGVGTKLLAGLAYASSDSEVDVLTGAPILGPNERLAVTGTTRIRTAAPGWTPGLGVGIGLDLGTVLQHGNGFDLSLSVTNLGRMRWRTRVEDVTFDERTGESSSVLVARAATHRTDLPATVNLGMVRRFRTTTLAFDLRRGAGGQTWHLGGEQRLRGVALRGGLRIDAQHAVHPSVGFGLLTRRTGIDISVYSQAPAITGHRAWMLGVTLARYPQ